MTFRDFVDEYYARFREVLEEWDRGSLEKVLEVVEGVRARGGTLWVAGNGGSAAICDHLVCDVTKGAHAEGRPALRAVSLGSNMAMLTAIANDDAYSEVFRQQLAYYLQPDDALLLVSSSGDSSNVVEACRYAKERGVPTIAFVGFDGGRLRELADHVVWIPVDNYGMAEDSHQSLIHCLTQYLRARGASD